MISEKAKIFNENYDILKETIAKRISNRDLQNSLIRSIACYTEYRFKNINENTNTDALLEDINEVYCGIYDILKEDSSLLNKVGRSIYLLTEDTDERTNGERYNKDMNPNGDADYMQNKSGISTHFIRFGGSDDKNSKYTTMATPSPHFHSTVDHIVVPAKKTSTTGNTPNVTNAKLDNSNQNINNNQNNQRGNSWHFGHDEPETNARHNRIDDLFNKLGIPLNYNSPVDDLNDPFGHNLKNNNRENNNIFNNNNNNRTIRTNNNSNNNEDTRKQLFNTQNGLSVNDNINKDSSNARIALASANMDDDGQDRYYPRIGNEYSFPDPSEKAQRISSQYSLVTGNKPMSDAMKEFEDKKKTHLVVQNPETGEWVNGTLGNQNNKNVDNANNSNENKTAQNTNGRQLNVYRNPITGYYQPYIQIPTTKDNFDYKKVNNDSLKGVEGYATINDYVTANIDKDPNIRVINDTGKKDIQMAKKPTDTISQSESGSNKQDQGEQRITTNNNQNNSVLGGNKSNLVTGNVATGGKWNA